MEHKGPVLRPKCIGPEELEPIYYSILPVCYKNTKFYCNLHEKCNLQYVTTDGWSLRHSLYVMYSYLL